MTVEEFNIKYKDYLKSGHYGLALSKLEAVKYLDEEFQELIKIPGFKFSQIKGKFHWFCFYCDNVPELKVSEITNKLKEIYDTKDN